MDAESQRLRDSARSRCLCISGVKRRLRNTARVSDSRVVRYRAEIVATRASSSFTAGCWRSIISRSPFSLPLIRAISISPKCNTRVHTTQSTFTSRPRCVRVTIAFELAVPQVSTFITKPAGPHSRSHRPLYSTKNSTIKQNKNSQLL